MHATPRAPRSGGPPQRFVSIADVDPDLVDGIPDGDRQLARRVLARPVHALEACDPERLLTDDGAVGVLIVAGAVLRELSVAGRVCTEVLGPGDVLSPAPSGSLLRVPQTWKALPTASGIVLDAQFTAAAQRWPSLAANLHRRLLAQGHRSAVHAAVAQLPRVERRVLALMWHLADRWGRVTPFGVEVDLALTHEALGRLVGAQRPTVTLALADLAREGALTRSVRRTWLLARESRALLDPDETARQDATRPSA